MTAPGPARDARPADVRATEPGLARRLRDRLRRSGIGAADGARGRARGGVVVAAGATVDDALGVAPAGWWFADTPMVLVADEVCPTATRRAIGLGVRVVLSTARATPVQLAAAVGAARDGDGRIPAEVLFPPAASDPPAGPAVGLTPRQTSVVTLMADGCSNAEIATSLSCSEHTVKNVVYELMGRLRARTRSHAVAHAVRAGLI